MHRILSSTSSTTGWGFGTDGTGLRFTTYSETDYKVNASLAANVWTNIAVVFNGSGTSYTATFYINGVSAGTASGSAQAVSSSATYEIGGATTAAEFFQGTIDDLRFFATTLTAAQIADLANAPPTVATAASAAPSTVTASNASLSVLGADSVGQSTLSYSWSTTSKPSGAANPGFSTNNSNLAQSIVATFSAAGNYTLQATITDAGGLTATSSVNVTVNQTLTSIAVTPSTASLGSHASQQFAATAYDQFGAAARRATADIHLGRRFGRGQRQFDGVVLRAPMHLERQPSLLQAAASSATRRRSPLPTPRRLWPPPQRQVSRRVRPPA